MFCRHHFAPDNANGTPADFPGFPNGKLLIGNPGPCSTCGHIDSDSLFLKDWLPHVLSVPFCSWNCCSTLRGCSWRGLPTGSGTMQGRPPRAEGSLPCSACSRWLAYWSYYSPSFRSRTISARCAPRWRSPPPRSESARKVRRNTIPENGRASQPWHPFPVLRLQRIRRGPLLQLPRSSFPQPRLSPPPPALHRNCPSHSSFGSSSKINFFTVMA